MQEALDSRVSFQVNCTPLVGSCAVQLSPLSLSASDCDFTWSHTRMV